MGKFAVVSTGTISNILVWDGKNNDFTRDVGGSLIEIPADVAAGIGWGHDGEKFTAPNEPEKTKEQIIQEAILEKEGLINFANDYMNSKQWPGKAAIGRLKGDELEQYNLWLDYLDSLEVVDTSTAPNIAWPDVPE